MAATIVVLSGSREGLPELSLTLDSPRIVIGRGESCEVRLPDASVSARHASLRQRGADYVLLDEGSTNGTFMGPVRLPPQTPRVVRSGERVRAGRVWLEIRIEPAIVKGSPVVAARELALALVTRGLESQGIDPSHAADALADIERSADEVMADDEAPSPPAGPVDDVDETPAPEGVATDGTPTPAPAAAAPIVKKPRPADPGGWSMLDSVVVLIAMGVIALSILGGFWLLGR
jgi:predicted component of type VI protein secretion system